jgi:transcriptional regulator with XRE-family HTH domain
VAVASPTARRNLGIELKQLREAAHLKIEQAATAVEISDSHLSRIERGHVGVRPVVVRALLQTYKASDEVIERLAKIAVDTTKRGDKSWWQPYGPAISAKYATLMSLEDEATSVKAVGPLVVPGLLQTEDYARALLHNGPARLGPEEIETRVDARKARQAILTREDPPSGWFILDEAALHRQVGGRDVMNQQRRHLAELAQRPHIDIQVIPYARGAHAGTLGPLVILGFADGDDVVYCETYGGDLYPEAVTWYGDVFNRLAQDAAGKGESLDLILDAVKET